MSVPLRIAIAGCGKIASRHAAAAQQVGTLTAVCDTDAGAAERLAASTGTRCYLSLESMMEQESGIDLIAICTPNGWHARQSTLALEAGHHVLCEKPMSLSTADAQEMIATARRCGKRLFVVKSNRYNPLLLQLKQTLDGGGIGQVYSFQLNGFWNRPASYYEDSWHGTPLDGGPLFTQFSHYIDTLLWLFGDLKHVSGVRRNLAHKGLLHGEDTGIATLEMVSGLSGGLHWSVNSYQRNMEVSLTILAERATLRLGGAYLDRIEYQLAAEPVWAPDTGLIRAEPGHHIEIYENIVRALNDPRCPIPQAEDGFRTVSAIEAIYQSIPLT
ncbi:MAG: hypothetical protein RJA57_1576 [Bacteroidota bacterium]|jgi:predicted dehydrogenase